MSYNFQGQGQSTNKKKERERKVNQVRQSGQGSVSTYTKFNSGGNKQTKTNQNTRKIEQEQDSFNIKRVSQNISRRIQQGRTGKGWSQKELAMRVQERVQLIQQYEQGSATPNQQVISKLERALGVKLRGGDDDEEKKKINDDDDD